MSRNDTLTVRMYNVRFGDAILVTIPDKDKKGNTTIRRILIDVGNAPTVASKKGGDDTVFAAVVEDILEQLDGDPLDLYVMTHEHLDHVQGLPQVAWKVPEHGDLVDKLAVRHVWMTASADPDYYTTHKEAETQKKLHEAQLAAIRMHLGATEADEGPLASYLLNNNPAATTQCIEFLRGLNPDKTHYVHREASLAGTHPFKEAKLKVWGPEEDTSVYYAKLKPVALGAAAGAAAVVTETPAPPAPPPAGIDLESYLNLVESRSAGIADNLLAIDKAANDTSLVFCLSWRGWDLLFPGDAEEKSWEMMAAHDVLRPVHFLKVSHHGSHNGTPDDEILERFLPLDAPDQRTRSAAISTWNDTYGGIPHKATNTRLESRVELQTMMDHKTELFYELQFRAAAP